MSQPEPRLDSDSGRDRASNYVQNTRICMSAFEGSEGKGGSYCASSMPHTPNTLGDEQGWSCNCCPTRGGFFVKLTKHSLARGKKNRY